MENDMPRERTRELIRDNDSFDYSKFYDSEYDLDEDDRLYETNVDKDVEWVGVGDKGKDVKDDTSAFHGIDEDDVHSDYTNSDELCSFDDSSLEDDGVNVRKPKFPKSRKYGVRGYNKRSCRVDMINLAIGSGTGVGECVEAGTRATATGGTSARTSAASVNVKRKRANKEGARTMSSRVIAAGANTD
ncbi:unnamed protein product [Ilex paraguariensis]|uniref:Uncharacterized protein n=1 Tax=Ilex paraguariensis TaxID=185542 RepID=A0ABC8RXR6_9AQUA